MMIDPHIACIRVPRENGSAFYEGVMQRVAARSDQPQGVLLHFSADGPNGFLVGTVFRDSASMTEAFVQYSAPEAQNEMVATGNAVDMTREQYELERIFVEDEVEPEAFSLVPAEGITAFTSELVGPSLASYREISRRGDWYSRSVEGRIAHIAYSTPSGVNATTFWRSRADGERWYEQHLGATLDELEPGKMTPERREASWLTLHSFLVSIPKGDPVRHYTREIDKADPA